MGGRVGILLALMQPQLIDKLVVVDSSVIVNDNSRRRWSALRQACSSLVKIEDELKKVHGYERLSVANKVRSIKCVFMPKFYFNIFYSGHRKYNCRQDGPSQFLVELDLIRNS